MRRSLESPAAAEIHLLHVGILADLVRPAVGNHTARGQHDDPVREGEYHVHIVFGEQDLAEYLTA